ncbi:hypothetical protein P8882_04295 [Bacillus haynesii]|nr:hypothetical protein [Bacillus haynesii]
MFFYYPTYGYQYPSPIPGYYYFSSSYCQTCQSGQYCCDKLDELCNCINGFCECIPFPRRIKVLTQDMTIQSFSSGSKPLWKLGGFFDYYFPNQIAVPPHRTNEIVTADFKNMTVKEIIDNLGLKRLREELIPHTNTKRGREKYCCETFFITPDGMKYPKGKHNYKEYPELVEGRCFVYALEDKANSYDYRRGECSYSY